MARQQYTEHRLIVKYRNRKQPTHVGGVIDPIEWIKGQGPWRVLDDTFAGGVEWLKVVEYGEEIGIPAKRTKEWVFLRNPA